MLSVPVIHTCGTTRKDINFLHTSDQNAGKRLLLLNILQECFFFISPDPTFVHFLGVYLLGKGFCLT